MDRIAKFEKVSLSEFIDTWDKLYGVTECNRKLVEEIWNEIELPERSTEGSAGYDIHTPVGFKMKPGDNIVIPSGIRCTFDVNYGMLILPRSGLGFKYRLSIANTVPLIDSDYSQSKNTGHIMLKLCYDGFRTSLTFTPFLEERVNNKPSITCSDDKTEKNLLVCTIAEKEEKEDVLVLKQNDRIVQAIFTKLGFTIDDKAVSKRSGGLGSTGN